MVTARRTIDEPLPPELAAELAEQEEFLRSGKRPAAAVQRVSRLPSQAGSTAAQSSSSASSSTTRRAPDPSVSRGPTAAPLHGPKDVIDGNVLPILNPNVRFPPRERRPTSAAEQGPPEAPQVAIMGDIRERKLSVGAPRTMIHERGFPRALHRDQLGVELRSQLRAVSARPSNTGVVNNAPPVKCSAFTLDAEIRASGIDAENRSAIAAMSEDEIRRAQQKMFSILEPGLIEKLRRGRAAGSTAVTTTMQTSLGRVIAPSAAPPAGNAVAIGVSTYKEAVIRANSRAQNEQPIKNVVPTLEDLKLEWTLPADTPPLMNTPSRAESDDSTRNHPGSGDHPGPHSVESGSAEVALAAALRAAGMHDERFDFSGELVVGERSQTEGLHHHGERPLEAGYTLAELVHLSRSTVPAQRTSALRTLARCWQCQRSSKLGQMIKRWTRDADVAVLLRVSLDDSHASAVHAALDAAAALSELFGGPSAAAILSATHPAHSHWRGYEGPHVLAPPSTSSTQSTQRESKDASRPMSSQTTDADACRADLLAGWVRMGMTARLRYLIDAGELAPVAKQRVLLLLCMIAQHSISLASSVALTPHLADSLSGIVRSVDTDGDSLRLALALVQILIASGRTVAEAMLKGGILPALHAVYIRSLPSTLPLPGGSSDCARRAEVQLHGAAAAGAWRSLAAYGLTAPSLASWFPILSQATHPGVLPMMCTPACEVGTEACGDGRTEARVAMIATSLAQTHKDKSEEREKREERGLATLPCSTYARCQLSAATFYLLESFCTISEASEARTAETPSLYALGEEQANQETHYGNNATSSANETTSGAADPCSGSDGQPISKAEQLIALEAAGAFGGAYRVGEKGSREGGGRSLTDAEAAILSRADASSSERWRHTAAFVPAAARLLISHNDAPALCEIHDITSEDAPRSKLTYTHYDARSVLSGSCLHFLASFLLGLPRNASALSATGGPLELLPWCETVVARVMLPAACRTADVDRHANAMAGGNVTTQEERSTCESESLVPATRGPSGMLGWALSVVEAAAAASNGSTSACGPPFIISAVALTAALESLLGFVRFWWQLTRQHRGLLLMLARADSVVHGGAANECLGTARDCNVKEVRLGGVGDEHQRGAAETCQLLWRLCAILPHAVGPLGRGELAAHSSAHSKPETDNTESGVDALERKAHTTNVLQIAGRLSYFVTQMIDAIDSAGAPAAASATSDATCLHVRARDARTFIQLVACGLTWMRPGDETFAQALASALLLSPRWINSAGGAFLAAAEGGSLGDRDDSALPRAKEDATGDGAAALRAALLATYIQLLRLPSYEAQQEAQARIEGRGERLSALRPVSARSCLPLPLDWLATPVFAFGTDANGVLGEEGILGQLKAALGLLRAFSRGGTSFQSAPEHWRQIGVRNTPEILAGALAPLRWVPRSRLLCRGLQVFELPLAPWRDPAISGALDALLDAWCGGGDIEALERQNLRGAGASGRDDAREHNVGSARWLGSDLLGCEAGTDVTSLLRRVLDVYLAESMGDPTFTAWVLLPLRSAEPLAMRIDTFTALDQLAHKLLIAQPPPHRVQAWAAPLTEIDVPKPVGVIAKYGARTAASVIAKAASGCGGTTAGGDGDRLLELIEESLTRGNLAKADITSFLLHWALHQLAAAARSGRAPLLAERVAEWPNEWRQVVSVPLGRQT